MKECIERYLIAASRLERNGGVVKSIDVSHNLGVTRTDVFRAVKTMKLLGWVDQQPYGRLRLTPKGRARAEKCDEVYHLLYTYFRANLGLEGPESESNAYQILHILSDTAIDRILKKK